jgi:N-sulfoglucosamine sulfohydrolase
MPQKPFYQRVVYRLQRSMIKKRILLKDAGKVNATQMKWFATKPIEELCDTEKDPYKSNNLVKNPAYKHKLAELKAADGKWMAEVGDLRMLPDLELRNKMWGNNTTAPATSKPELVKANGAHIIKFDSQGASIGCILTPKTGKAKIDGNAYKVYHYGLISLN